MFNKELNTCAYRRMKYNGHNVGGNVMDGKEIEEITKSISNLELDIKKLDKKLIDLEKANGNQRLEEEKEELSKFINTSKSNWEQKSKDVQNEVKVVKENLEAIKEDLLKVESETKKDWEQKNKDVQSEVKEVKENLEAIKEDLLKVESETKKDWEQKNKDVQSEIQKTREDLEKIKEELEQFLVEEDKKIEHQVEIWNQNISNDRKEQMEKLEGLFETTSQKMSDKKEDFDEIIAEAKKHYQEYDNDFSQLLGEVASDSISNHYVERAKEFNKRSRYWSYGAIVAMIAFIVFAIVILRIAILDFENSNSFFRNFPEKLFLTIGMATLITYCSKQASQFEKVEKENIQKAFELKTIGPYLSPVNEKEKELLRVAYFKRIFLAEDKKETINSESHYEKTENSEKDNKDVIDKELDDQ